MATTKQIKITLTENQIDLIKKMKEEQGFNTFNEVIYHCIRYTMTYSSKQNPTVNSTAKKTNKVNEAKNKKQMKQLEIIDKLNGTLSPDGMRVSYYKYDEKLRFEQVIPVDMLEEIMVETQYSPSRERVEKLQALKKTNY